MGLATAVILLVVSPAPGDGLRVWTDASGNHKTEAAFVETTANGVRLRKPDQTIILVPLNRLSAADREWVGRRNLPAPVRAYLDQAETERKAAMKNTTRDLEKAKKYLLKQQRARHRATVLKAKARVEQLEKQLGRLEKNEPSFVPTINLRKLNIGDAGLPEMRGVRGWHWRVMQVIDEENMLVTCESFPSTTYADDPVQTTYGPTFWIRGMSTANIADRDWFKPEKPFYVLGSTTYRTAAGATATVRVLKAIVLPDEPGK